MKNDLWGWGCLRVVLPHHPPLDLTQGWSQSLCFHFPRGRPQLGGSVTVPLARTLSGQRNQEKGPEELEHGRRIPGGSWRRGPLVSTRADGCWLAPWCGRREQTRKSAAKAWRTEPRPKPPATSQTDRAAARAGRPMRQSRSLDTGRRLEPAARR